MSEFNQISNACFEKADTQKYFLCDTAALALPLAIRHCKMLLFRMPQKPLLGLAKLKFFRCSASAARSSLTEPAGSPVSIYCFSRSCAFSLRLRLRLRLLPGAVDDTFVRRVWTQNASLAALKRFPSDLMRGRCYWSSPEVSRECASIAGSSFLD